MSEQTKTFCGFLSHHQHCDVLPLEDNTINGINKIADSIDDFIDEKVGDDIDRQILKELIERYNDITFHAIINKLKEEVKAIDVSHPFKPSLCHKFDPKFIKPYLEGQDEAAKRTKYEIHDLIEKAIFTSMRIRDI